MLEKSNFCLCDTFLCYLSLFIILKQLSSCPWMQHIYITFWTKLKKNEALWLISWIASIERLLQTWWGESFQYFRITKHMCASIIHVKIILCYSFFSPPFHSFIDLHFNFRMHWGDHKIKSHFKDWMNVFWKISLRLSWWKYCSITNPNYLGLKSGSCLVVIMCIKQKILTVWSHWVLKKYISLSNTQNLKCSLIAQLFQ